MQSVMRSISSSVTLSPRRSYSFVVLGLRCLAICCALSMLLRALDAAATQEIRRDAGRSACMASDVQRHSGCLGAKVRQGAAGE